LRIKTNIRRMIARPDACGDSGRRVARFCTIHVNAVIIGRRIAVAARTLAPREARA
jgi:hypothetical protein